MLIALGAGVPCLQLREFGCVADGATFAFQVLQAKHVVYLWLGPGGPPQTLGNLVGAVQSKFASVPSLSGLLHSTADEESRFSSRLLQAFPGLMFLVAYNLPVSIAQSVRDRCVCVMPEPNFDYPCHRMHGSAGRGWGRPVAMCCMFWRVAVLKPRSSVS